VEGKGFDYTARYYDRLPARAEKTVREAVWNLSRHSAGMAARFETDATTIHVRYDLFLARIAMSHMPATGVSGVDLYARDSTGRDRWLNVARPEEMHVEAKLADGIDAPADGTRLYTAYLPLYNGVEKMEIGVPSGSKFHGVAPRSEKPILFYGTSIMHGACASRPGMSISALVGRRFDLPVINLGFSGNGRLEMEVAEFLVELDPAVYALDCLPNLNGEQVAERTEPLVRRLRKARPDTPILMVEDRTNTSAWLRSSLRERHAGNREAFRAAYQNLQKAGVKGLHYLEGRHLLGNDNEAATDGSHPNDLGMVRYADAYEEALRPILS
jgi:lysophospholipase L1-like esterase